jgi:hypothetical protein
VLFKQLHDPPPLEGGAAAAIPAAIKPIIQRAMEKRREDRFQTATELQQALSAARDTLVAASADTTVAIAARVQTVRVASDPHVTRRPHLLWYSLAGGGLLIIAVVAAVMGTSSFFAPRAPDQPSQKRPEPQTQAAREPSKPAAPAETVAKAEMPAVKPACDRGDAGACRTDCDSGGVAAACTQLGLILNRGAGGVAPDLGAAALYYERGCDGGDLAGCNNLGTLYDFGALGLRDRTKAATLYDRACTGGYLDACANLGRLYLTSREASPQQKARAHDLLQKACSAGIARACG